MLFKFLCINKDYLEKAKIATSADVNAIDRKFTALVYQYFYHHPIENGDDDIFTSKIFFYKKLNVLIL